MPVNPPTLADLRAPTPEDEIKQRPTFEKRGGKTYRSSKTLSYVDARYVMDVLDETIGPENWRDDYEVLGGGAVCCTLSVLVSREAPDSNGVLHPEPEWVAKTDVGVPSTIEPMKGAFSDAFKRAAVKWGIGRDLYDDREDEMAAPADTRPIRERTTDDEDEPLPYGDEPAARPAARRAATGNGRARTGWASSARNLATKQAEYDAFMAVFDPENSPWYCPDHDSVRVGAPFTSADGKPISGSLKCELPWAECKQTGPWISTELTQQVAAHAR